MSTNTSSTPNNNKKLLIIAASLTLFFALLEIIYGFISGSLMIIGDGIHMSSDAISLILSLIAAVVATRASTNKRTFGYKRFEPIAAFINGLTLVLVPLYIIFEAINRMITPIEINPTQMLVVGLIGLIINAIVGFVLSKGQSNLNMRSAILHVFADLITSLSAVIVSLAIMFYGLNWLDPVGSIITSIIIIRGGIKITKEAFNILMEGTPKGYSVENIKKVIQNNNEVEVEDIKLWCVNEEEIYTMIRIKSTQNFVNDIHLAIKQIVSKNTNIPVEHIYVDVQS
ncbi:cation diffusion facilitator family transporter [Ureibacillus manganicus]|uniref:Heavy metal resistance protein CzcD n=1 Tax=Ureibacillus manganicus DSM 26584 TaxID=1384049 RepID=A0A0A3IX12_9BACL|nr:cation diffusion facilitator family transporter [Ureibacillus manganicus]KGR79347.1 heavy metal resistance protein CzcD [Ureibacillus manganicus DSM 26584]